METNKFRPKAKELSHRLSRRGPDSHGMYVGENSILCHERLIIMGLEKGE
jgi:asparagine synthase (glutamine-hydrolysing)